MALSESITKLHQKTVNGLNWSAATQLARQAILLIVTVILARRLLPSDFGLISIAVVFYDLTFIVNELGLNVALIQKRNLDGIHYVSVFWLNVLMGVLFLALMWPAAPVIARFYGQPGLEGILKALSVNLLLAALGIIQDAIFSREMEFKKLGLIQTAAVFVAGVAAVAAAYAGRGVWSLVYQMLVFTSVNTALLWYFSPWRPGFQFSFSAVRELSVFGANVTGYKLVSYLTRNIDYLLIGKFLGIQAVGIYMLAYRLMFYPVQNVFCIVNKVMISALSAVQNDLEKVRAYYTATVKTVALLMLPVFCGLFFIAPELIRVFFGEQWAMSAGLLQILCVCGLAKSIGAINEVLYQTQGRPDIQFRFQLGVALPVTAAAILVGIFYGGLPAVAFLYTLATLFLVSLSQHIANGLIALRFSRFFRTRALSSVSVKP